MDTVLRAIKDFCEQWCRDVARDTEPSGNAYEEDVARCDMSECSLYLYRQGKLPEASTPRCSLCRGTGIATGNHDVDDLYEEKGEGRG